MDFAVSRKHCRCPGAKVGLAPRCHLICLGCRNRLIHSNVPPTFSTVGIGEEFNGCTDRTQRHRTMRYAFGPPLKPQNTDRCTTVIRPANLDMAQRSGRVLRNVRSSAHLCPLVRAGTWRWTWWSSSCIVHRRFNALLSCQSGVYVSGDAFATGGSDLRGVRPGSCGAVLGRSAQPGGHQGRRRCASAGRGRTARSSVRSGPRGPTRSEPHAPAPDQRRSR